MQKFFCDLCDAEIAAHNVRRDREYVLTKSGPDGRPGGHTVIVTAKNGLEKYRLRPLGRL